MEKLKLDVDLLEVQSFAAVEAAGVIAYGESEGASTAPPATPAPIPTASAVSGRADARGCRSGNKKAPPRGGASFF